MKHTEHYSLEDVARNRKYFIDTLLSKFPEHADEIGSLKTEVGPRAIAVVKIEGISQGLAEKIRQAFPLSIR